MKRNSITINGQMEKRDPIQIVAVDSGNENVKVASNLGVDSFVHALLPLSPSHVESLRDDNQLDSHDSIYRVNGKYFAVGDYAIRKGSGAIRTGETRYTPDYYGILAAIATFEIVEDSHNNLFLYGGHTPKDKIYRQDLINSVIESKVGAWEVSHLGKTRVYQFSGAKGYHEPVGVYRYATLSPDGKSLKAGWLRSGFCAIIDIGGYTTALSVAEDGKIEYDATVSHVYGINRVLDELWALIKRNNRAKLKGANPDRAALRAALANPQNGYDARGLKTIDCAKEVKQALQMYMRELSIMFSNYGGAAAFHNVLIGGGGATLLYDYIRRDLGHNSIYAADKDVRVLFKVGVQGALATARAALAAGNLLS